MNAPHYHINLFWSVNDGCWIADVPDLKYCSAHGDTPSAAITEIELAMECWLETARSEGMTIPEPRYHPALGAAA